MPDLPDISKTQCSIPDENPTYSPLKVCHTYASQVLHLSYLSTLSERSWNSASDTDGEEVPTLAEEPQDNMDKHCQAQATYENENDI